MTYLAHIKNGVAILDSAVSLPDGTAVRVEVQPGISDFWNGPEINELAQAQGTKPIADVAALAIDWPEEDNLEDLFALIHQARR